MKFFDLNTLDVNRKFKIVIGKRGAGKMKIIYYRGFKITRILCYNSIRLHYFVYYVEDSIVEFFNLEDAKDYIERNYLR